MNLSNHSFTKKDSSSDKSIRDCDNKCFNTFDHICEYEIRLNNINSNTIIEY